MTNANNTTKNGNTYGTKRGGRRGFTLIEILIVVVILGVLAALVIPGVTSALSDANDKAAVARASQITTMVTRFNQFKPTGTTIALNSTADYTIQVDATGAATGGSLKPLVDANYCAGKDLLNPVDESKGWTWNATKMSFEPKR